MHFVFDRIIHPRFQVPDESDRVCLESGESEHVDVFEISRRVTSNTAVYFCFFSRSSLSRGVFPLFLVFEDNQKPSGRSVRYLYVLRSIIEEITTCQRKTGLNFFVI